MNTDTLSDYSSKYLQQYRDGGFETILVSIRREQVLRFLAAHRPRRIVEIGCGMEPLFVFHNEFDTFTVVEPSAEFVAEARARAAGDGRVTVMQDYLENVVDDVRKATPDAVLVSSLLHEVPEPIALLASIRAICGSETVIHFNVPNVNSFHRLLAVEMGLIADVFEQSETEKKFHRHTRFDRARFIAMLTEAGFDVMESGTYFVKPFTHGQMEALLRDGTFDGRLIEGLARMAKHLPENGCEMYANARLR